jgi:hypothetical protein
VDARRRNALNHCFHETILITSSAAVSMGLYNYCCNPPYEGLES